MAEQQVETRHGYVVTTADGRCREFGRRGYQSTEILVYHTAALADNKRDKPTDEVVGVVVVPAGEWADLAKARAQRDELYAIINTDGSLTTHEEHVDLARDGAAALARLPEMERLKVELAAARTMADRLAKLEQYVRWRESLVGFVVEDGEIYITDELGETITHGASVQEAVGRLPDLVRGVDFDESVDAIREADHAE